MAGQHGAIFIVLAICLLGLACPVRSIDTTQVYYEPLLQHYLWVRYSVAVLWDVMSYASQYAGTAYCDSGPIMNWTCNMCLYAFSAQLFRD
jgi:hypothetical protein